MIEGNHTVRDTSPRRQPHSPQCTWSGGQLIPLFRVGLKGCRSTDFSCINQVLLFTLLTLLLCWVRCILACNIHTRWSIKRCHSIYSFITLKHVVRFKKNSFTVGLSSKFATRLVSYFPPHLICVTTLPCEIQSINISNTLDVFRPNTIL